MSRTVRRKNSTRCEYVDEYWFTYEDGWRQTKRKTGKEYRKGWWRFHNDTLNFPNKLNHWNWGQVRVKNRIDLVQWLRDEEHECIFWEDVTCHDWL